MSQAERLLDVLTRLDCKEAELSDADVQEVFRWMEENHGPGWMSVLVAIGKDRERMLLEDAARTAEIDEQRARDGLPPIVDDKGVDQTARLGQMADLILRLGLLDDNPPTEGSREHD